MSPRERIPPDPKKIPVLHIRGVPGISQESWELHIEGLVENSMFLTFKAFLKLPQIIIQMIFTV